MPFATRCSTTFSTTRELGVAGSCPLPFGGNKGQLGGGGNINRQPRGDFSQARGIIPILPLFRKKFCEMWSLGRLVTSASERKTPGSGESARSRTPILSGWHSSAAPAFRAFGSWRARVEGIWAYARAAATNEEDARDQSRGVHSWPKEARPVVGRRRCVVREASFFSRAHWAPTSERGWGASLNPTKSISLDAPARRHTMQHST